MSQLHMLLAAAGAHNVTDRYAVCGCVTKSPDGVEKFNIQLWDTTTGRAEQSDLTGAQHNNSLCHTVAAINALI